MEKTLENISRIANREDILQVVISLYHISFFKNCLESMFLLTYVPFVRTQLTVRISTMARSLSVSNVSKQSFKTLPVMIDIRGSESAHTLMALSNVQDLSSPVEDYRPSQRRVGETRWSQAMTIDKRQGDFCSVISFPFSTIAECAFPGYLLVWLCNVRRSESETNHQYTAYLNNLSLETYFLKLALATKSAYSIYRVSKDICNCLCFEEAAHHDSRVKEDAD